MLDVHSPHERIRGFRDFLLHLLTITIGLLIALGLEGLVELRHHNHLRAEAEENLKREIADNRKEVASTLAEIAKDRENLVAALTFLQMEHPKGSLTLRFNMSNLNNASWSTASATGALNFIDYPRVQQFANIYQRQSAFQALQTKTFGDFLNMQAHVIYTFDTKHLETADRDEAEREVQLTLAQLHAMDQLGADLDSAYTEVLKQ
jgi:hypothetical protein